MHEFSIAEQLLEQIVTIAADNGVTTVQSVELEIGALELVVSEALRAAFVAAAEGTVAQDAELTIKTVPARAVCGACAKEYETSIANYACPGCGAAAAEIVAGRGIVLRALDCLTEEGEENG